MPAEIAGREIVLGPPQKPVEAFAVVSYDRKEHSVGLRFGTSFGRSPQDRVYARPVNRSTSNSCSTAASSNRFSVALTFKAALNKAKKMYV